MGVSPFVRFRVHCFATTPRYTRSLLFYTTFLTPPVGNQSYRILAKRPDFWHKSVLAISALSGFPRACKPMEAFGERCPMRGLNWFRLFSRFAATALLCFNAPFFAAAQIGGGPVPYSKFTVSITEPVSGQVFTPGS